jgi:hypothetical protein
MRTYSGIEQMAAQDYSIGLTAHYKPLADLINQRGYKDIIEIGTAYGGNAYHLRQNTELEELICIDPYKYYPAMPGFTCQQEYDTLFQFASDRIGKYYGISMLRMTSKDALKIMDPADLVFLDGSHEYEDVKWECENYLNIVRVGGILSGHDYNIFEGVNKAVDEFARLSGCEVNQLPGNIWYIEK